MRNVTLSLARSLLYPVSETLIPRDRHEAMMRVPKAGAPEYVTFPEALKKKKNSNAPLLL